MIFGPQGRRDLTLFREFERPQDTENAESAAGSAPTDDFEYLNEKRCFNRQVARLPVVRMQSANDKRGSRKLPGRASILRATPTEMQSATTILLFREHWSGHTCECQVSVLLSDNQA